MTHQVYCTEFFMMINSQSVAILSSSSKFKLENNLTQKKVQSETLNSFFFLCAIAHRMDRNLHLISSCFKKKKSLSIDFTVSIRTHVRV